MSADRFVRLAGDGEILAAVCTARSGADASAASGSGSGVTGPTGATGATVLQTNRRRTLERFEFERSARFELDRRPGTVILKTHHLATGAHPLRERMKRALGRSGARREWRALEALHAAGVAVPRPLAYGRDAQGDECLVLEALDGEPLADRFAAADADERAHLVAALAATLEVLHAAGHVHGDLHLGNLHVDATSGRIFLLDLQRAHRAPCTRLPLPAQCRAHASNHARARDLARLELSLLRAGWPADLRAPLRARLRARLDRHTKRTEADDALLPRAAADRVRGRMRRLRRRLVRIAVPTRCAGLRDPELGESQVLRAIEQARTSATRRARRGGRSWIAEVECEGRGLVVKWSAAGSWIDRAAAAVRGSRARRAFLRGLRARILVSCVARPLAYLETRAAGLPGESWLVLERVGEEDLDRHRPPDAAAANALARALADGLADLHAVGLDHRDLKGSNLRLTSEPHGPRFWLVDLEDLRGPTRPSDDRRIEALAALNASLADEDFGAAFREKLFADYCARLPFADPALARGGAWREILRRARARGHRHRGDELSPS